MSYPKSTSETWLFRGVVLLERLEQLGVLVEAQDEHGLPELTVVFDAGHTFSDSFDFPMTPRVSDDRVIPIDKGGHPATHASHIRVRPLFGCLKHDGDDLPL